MANGNGTPAKVNEVVGRVLTDPQFADQVRSDGIAAIQGGAGSEAWNKYFEHFAPEPGALAEMGGAEGAAGCTCDSTTFTTLSTLVTPIPTCCGATTTVTTTTGQR